jgi:hypothetical protein
MGGDALMVLPTLEFAYVLNVGTVHEGTPFSNFSIFAPYMLFLAFKKQNWNLQP